MSDTEVDAVHNLTLEAVNALGRPFIIEGPDSRSFAAVPAVDGGWSLNPIAPLPNSIDVLLPKLVTQHVQVQTAASLIEYVNRFQNEHTTLFADITRNSIQAIIDYHRQPTANSNGPGSESDKPASVDLSDLPIAALAVHRATLALPFSVEWQTWNGVSDRLMSHRDFASFLEENSIDILPLEDFRTGDQKGDETIPTTLLEMCRDLQVINNVNFSSTVRDGDYTSVAFQKENDAATKGGIKLPPQIKLHIPVYFGEPAVVVTAFIRKRVDDNGLRLGVKLSRIENVRQDEFHRIVEGVVEETNHLTRVYGSPQ